MSSYFNNGGIIENLPLNPINKNLKASVYVLGGLSLLAIIGCVYTYVELNQLTKKYLALELLGNKQNPENIPSGEHKIEDSSSEQAKT